MSASSGTQGPAEPAPHKPLETSGAFVTLFPKRGWKDAGAPA
jgi:hypothetical protein